MSKIVYVKENPFKVGMKFEKYIDVANFLGIKYINSTLVQKELNHYCKWYKDNNKSPLVIDEVFDEVIPFTRKGFRYEIGDEIKTKQGKVLILDRYITKDDKRNKNGRDTNACYYKCKCLIDGYEFNIQESRLNSGAGCPVCSKNTVIPGVHSLYDCFPEVVQYLKNPEEAKQILPYSTKRVACKCPYCGAEKDVIVSYLAQHGFKCTVCSDNISYPNKFIREMLDQLGVEFIPEKSFDWSNKKLYDQYVSKYNMIIENHGSQHFKEIKGSVFGTLAEQQENDKLKFDMAMENGIDKYVVLDCRTSSVDWIKKSIMESELPTILGFTENDIDWDKCDTMAQFNAEIKKVCDAYMKNRNLSELVEICKHNMGVITRYLKIGAKCGFCDYETNNPDKNGNSIKGQSKRKPIYCITDDIYFMSQAYCESYYNGLGIVPFSGETLNKYINKGKSYNNKQFVFITKREYNEKYDKSETDSSVKVIGEKFKDRYVKED